MHFHCRTDYFMGYVLIFIFHLSESLIKGLNDFTDSGFEYSL